MDYELPEPAEHDNDARVDLYTAGTLRAEVAKAEQRGRDEMRDADLLEPIGRESLLGAIARGWCHEANANKSMGEDLANAIVKEVDALYATRLHSELDAQLMEQNTALDAACARLERVNQGMQQASKPLTDKQITDLLNETPRGFARAIEAAQGITGEEV